MPILVERTSPSGTWMPQYDIQLSRSMGERSFRTANGCSRSNAIFSRYRTFQKHGYETRETNFLTLFRPEDFILTSDAEHVLAKLKSEGKRAHVIAGGTGFYELARRGYIPEVKTVVSIMKLDLSYVNRETPGLIRIGATTSLQRLLESGI